LASGEIGLNLYSITPTLATFAQSDAEGIASSSDTRLGLDETLRNFIICDRGDIATDFTLAASASPRFYIYDLTPTNYSYRDYGNLVASATFEVNSTQYTNSITADLDAGDMFTFDSDAGIDLTDANAEQAWMKFEPAINQTSTATWYGLWSDVTVTTEGDGSTGFGNKYLLLTEADSEKFSVGAEADSVGAQIEGSGLVQEFIYEAALIDDGVLDLPASDSGGHGWVQAGDGEETMFFTYTSAGVVTKLADSSANTANTDSDTDLCVFDNGSNIAIKNMLGATKAIKGVIWYVKD